MDPIDLLQRQFEFLTRKTTVEFILRLPAFLGVLEGEPRLRVHLDDIEEVGRAELDRLAKAQKDLADSVRAVAENFRFRFPTSAVSLEHSRSENEPPGVQTPWTVDGALTAMANLAPPRLHSRVKHGTFAESVGRATHAVIEE